MNLSDAAEVRQILDLRIGLAFTRWQHWTIKRNFREVFNLPDNSHFKCISYGPCQFPAMGFVVKSYLTTTKFERSIYYTVCLEHASGVKFFYDKIFTDKNLADNFCQKIYHRLDFVKLLSIKTSEKKKFRPKALDTVTLEILASRKLKIPAKTALNVAEKLYLRGLISYPRTETNTWPKHGINFKKLCLLQANHPVWGNFAKNLLHSGFRPNNGTWVGNFEKVVLFTLLGLS